ncbi:hypothetical protein L208DRAFT_1400257 [Tricholoma matsutake]|nr:hypothetical protein L208DRAFT_1400257 [Tricholoma matsutake 945]
MSRVSQLRNITRRLLAAGYAKHWEGEGEYLLYIDAERSFLYSKHWRGDSFGDQEFVASSVRENSTAAYLISETGIFVIGITHSSHLSVYEYDSDANEWVEVDKHPITGKKVHGDGKLATSIGANGRVFFQDPSQHLICLDARSSTVLPANPVIGSPISTSVVGDQEHVYYISVNDLYIHDVTSGDGKWMDTIVIKYTFNEAIRGFVVMGNGSGADEAWVLTEENTLLKFTAEGGKTRLGTKTVSRATSPTIHPVSTQSAVTSL